MNEKQENQEEVYIQIMKKQPKQNVVSNKAFKKSLLNVLPITVILIFFILIFEFFIWKEIKLERIVAFVFITIMICAFLLSHFHNNIFNDLIYDEYLAWEKEVVEPYLKTIPRKISTKIYKIDLNKNKEKLNFADVIFKVEGELINRPAKINVDENIEETYVSYIKIKYDIDSVRYDNFYKAGDIKRAILHINESELKHILK